MAARDQKVQSIYVITVSILCGLLLIGWLYTAFTSSTVSKQLEEAQQKANAARASETKLNNQMQLVNKMLGSQPFSEAEYNQIATQLAGDPEMQKLIDQFGKDMANFGPNTPQDQRNYATLVNYLLGEVRSRNVQLNETKGQLANAEKENVAVMTREREASANEKKRADDLEKQLGNERAAFTATLDATQKTVEDVSKSLTVATQNHAKEKNKLQAETTAKQAEVDRLRKLNAEQRDLLDRFRGDDFQSAQGQVTGVSIDGDDVWLNLGRRDRLRVGTKFAVIDPEQGRISDDAEPKAHVEVIQVEEKQARAKILRSSNSDPIVEGDYVYSVAWQPGRKVQFALVGKMDWNGDGVDDREQIKQMIAESGGEVVEELLPDGRQVGQMTVDTRWLVIGEAYVPKQGQDPARSSYGTKYTDTINRSKDLSVSRINLDKLMSWLRSSSDDRSIPLGKALRPADISIQKERLPTSYGTVSDIYTEKYGIRPPEPK